MIFGLPDVFLLMFIGGFFDMENCIVIIDDGFYKLVKRDFQEKNKIQGKLLKSFRNICKNENFKLKHLFFCTAPPYQGGVPAKKEDFLRQRHDKLISLLGYKKWITVQEGRCQRLKVDGDYKYSQKGVDSWVVFNLARLKLDFPEVKKVILVSSDSDFAPIVKEVQDKDGIEVVLYTYFDKKRGSPFSLSNHLLDVCSRFVKLRKEDFE